MYKLVFFVPESHLEKVKSAVFREGAGQIGNYSRCCWQVLGQGQFMPLQGSTPFIGEQESLSVISEYKVEMVCSDEFIKKVVLALKAAHPFEEPAYEVYKLIDF